MRFNRYLANEWPGYVVGPDMEVFARDDDRRLWDGVYLLFNRGDVVYVGQSIYVSLRINQHRQKRVVFTHFGFVPVPGDLLKPMETAYLHALCPPLNTYLPEAEDSLHDKIVAAICAKWGRNVPHLTYRPGRPGLMIAERCDTQVPD